MNTTTCRAPSRSEWGPRARCGQQLARGKSLDRRACRLSFILAATCAGGHLANYSKFEGVARRRACTNFLPRRSLQAAQAPRSPDATPYARAASDPQ